MTAALDKIRAEIDELDADLRLRLLRRAELVAEIGAAKADNGTQGSPLRPMREMQQMRALRAWQRAEAPMLSEAGLLAIWREIIGMALAQQGGITITASPQAMPAARAHFGASLEYQNFSGALDALADNGRMIGVLTLAEAVAPPAGVGVFARLPLIGDATVLCYGARAQEDMKPQAVSLVRRAAAMPDDRELYQGADYVLVETMNVGDDAVWGHYLTLGDAS
jgi:chorismate mutase